MSCGSRRRRIIIERAEKADKAARTAAPGKNSPARAPQLETKRCLAGRQAGRHAGSGGGGDQEESLHLHAHTPSPPPTPPPTPYISRGFYGAHISNIWACIWRMYIYDI